MEEVESMSVSQIAVSREADKIRERFRSHLTKANKERPRESDIQALRDLLNGNKEMKLWAEVVGMGALAESQVLDTVMGKGGSGQGLRECWKRRLESLRADLGYATSPPLEQLLIQQVTLCWLNLNLTEFRHTNVMKQSITLPLGIYWDKRLTAAQRRFTRACESLARVRRLSRRIPIQVNIAGDGGQQVNIAS
jgi:hypothetical protein